MKLRLLFIALCIQFSIISFGQDEIFTQTIRGKVVDKDSKAPVWNAAVIVMDSTKVLNCLTDTLGDFKIVGVPVGRQDIKITCMGYADVFLQNIDVTSAKDVVLKIQMGESLYNLKEFKIEASIDKDKPLNSMANISARSFSMEEAQRFAGGLTDPLRMAQAYAGVSSTSNDNNEIVIRGNSPRGMLWRIEGVEVPNPNHFREDEGASGGGVCVLSSNVIANSDFFTSAFPAEYGNAISGVFDINLRKGNDEKPEYTVISSVVGTEIALEGPFSKKSKASYLVNYRYSTFALLQQVGIKVSKENITPIFQDLTFNLNFPSNKYGNTTIFGIGGKSSSGTSAAKDSITLRDRDQRFEAFNSGNVWITGITHNYLWKKKTLFKFVFTVMGEQNKMTNDTMDYKFVNHRIYNENLQYLTYRGTLTANHKFNSKLSMRSGLVFSNQNYNIMSAGIDFETNQNRVVFDNVGTANAMQAYSQWKYRLNEKVDINAGLHYSYFQLNKNQTLEPRLGMSWQVTPKQSFSAGFGLHSRMEPLSFYLTQVKDNMGNYVEANRNLGLSKAFHNVIGYDCNFSDNLHLKIEAYYQFLYNIPIVDSINSQFSTLNVRYGFITDPLKNKGTGRNYGVDITFEKYFTKGYYFLVTSSIFDSKYTAGDGILYNTTFNGNYIFNALAGREFSVGKHNNSILSTNIRFLYKGGMRLEQVDLTKSGLEGKEVIDPSGNYASRIADFYNLNMGVSFKRNCKRFAWTLALDVQNVTNKNNIIGMQYNVFANNVKYLYDLRILPILSFRIDF